MRYNDRYPEAVQRHYAQKTKKTQSQALPRFLLGVLLGLLLVIIAGTIFAYTSGLNKKNPTYRKADPPPEKFLSSKGNKEAFDAFTQVGQLRITTRAEEGKAQGEALIVSPWFTYPAGDTVLFEELSQKERKIKSIFQDYFSSRTKEELLSTDEQQIKDNLRKLINEQLVLGEIRSVYFEQYLFLE